MKIRIEVGEPRGFNAGEGGSNSFVCTVAEGLTGQREVERDPRFFTRVQHLDTDKALDKLVEYWFVATCEPITFEGSTFSSILFVPRYKMKKPPVDVLAEGQELVLHGAWRADGKPWDRQSVEEAHEGKVEIEGMLVVSAKKV